VKSGGNFEDILASDTPAIWRSHRPAKSGATGKMLEDIIRKAVALKAGSEEGRKEGTRKTEKSGTRKKEQGTRNKGKSATKRR
jgi:hypothetical protein